MRKMLIAIATVILLLAVSLSFVACAEEDIIPKETAGLPSLAKQADRDFKIMLFTDLQLWMNLEDNDSVYVMMVQLVEQEQPDLIVLPGDNVSGLATGELLEMLIAKMDSYKIPWAPVYGNHDTEGIASLESMSELYESSEYCLFERGSEDMYGMGNYAVNIASEEAILYTLFFFDNGRYHIYEDGTEKEVFIDPAQIAWYERTVNAVSAAEGKTIPSMTFMHFAMPEFRTAVETLCTKGEDGKYYVPDDLGYGYCDYLPGVAPVNTGLFAKMKELNSTTHVFCGHDHENNASILYEGVRFTYGLKTGISPRPWNHSIEQGATIVTIGDSVNVYNKVMWRA